VRNFGTPYGAVRVIRLVKLDTATAEPTVEHVREGALARTAP
jgi:hypothetical protein